MLYKHTEENKMTDKTYTVVGTSVCNGKMKVRWATDMMRIKVLQRTGHSDIELFELPSAMTKTAAVQYMIDTHGAKLSHERVLAAREALAKRSEVTAEEIVKAVA
jgi:hypothetical protein